MDTFFAPDDAARLRPLHLLWSVQLQQEKRGSARQTFRILQSLRLHSTQDQGYLSSAAAAQLEVEGHPQEAEAQYSRAVAAWSESGRGETTDVATLLVALGKLQTSQGRYLEAGKSLNRALAIVQSASDAVAMDFVNVLVNRATLYARQGKWQAAAEDQGSAMSMADRDARLDPSQRKVMLANFAHILRRAHRAPEARSMEARARAIHTPESANAVVDLSELVYSVNARGK